MAVAQPRYTERPSFNARCVSSDLETDLTKGNGIITNTMKSYKKPLQYVRSQIGLVQIIPVTLLTNSRQLQLQMGRNKSRNKSLQPV
jgi:hypothetical protein